MRSQYGMLAAVLIVGMALGSILVPQGANGQGERFVARVPEEFPTIQAAIDAVAEGGTVLIGPGVYKENVQIRKSLRLVGAGQERVQIKYEDPDRPIIEILPGAAITLQIYIQDLVIMDSSLLK